MRFVKTLHSLLLSLFFICLFTTIGQAKSTIPDSLQEWVPWVLHNQEDQLCTSSITGRQKFCVWPQPLQLDVSAGGGTFSQNWNMETSGWILLPGNERYWPQQVLINNQEALVVNKNGLPAVYVESGGEYALKGQFAWQSLPESLPIAAGTGLVSSFTLEGQKMVPRLTGNTLWISKKITSEQQQDVVQTDVYRHISDGIPMLITTHILVKVSGKPRELIVDWQVPENQIPIDLRSSLPVKIGSDNKIHMQARPGSYTIIYRSRINEPVDALQFNSTSGPKKEYWSFKSKNNLRIVKISGVDAVDPSQTSIPQKWQSLPGYLVKTGETMVFETIKRGDSDPSPNNLQLSRTLWLDASGKGMTVQDRLSGVIHNTTRLEMQKPAKLGRVTINGKDQLITKMSENHNSGVEVRQGSIDAKAVSRIEGVRQFPAVGWDQRVENLSAELILQPGWKLFHAQGIDSTRSWISKWSLLDCFIVLIIVIACFKILGLIPSSIAFVALVLSYHDYDAPVFIWLAILACIAIIKTAPHLRHIKIVKGAKILLLIGLVVMVLPYSVQQLREGIYPQLERSTVPYVNNFSAPMVQEKMMVEQERVMSSVSKYADTAQQLAGAPRIKKREVVEQFDIQSRVQSGPGIPDRKWNTVPLRWNGPVDVDLYLKLYVISPLLNTILIFFKVIAIFLLLFFMVRSGKNTTVIKDEATNSSITEGLPANKLVSLLVLLLPLCTFIPTGSCMDYPSTELLENLQKRLLEPAECFPHCADFTSMDITVQGTTLSMEITANALAETAVPLPGGQGISWQSAAISGETRPVLAKDEKLWLVVPQGQQRIKLQGQVLKTDFQCALPLKPHRVSFSGDEGWSLAGVDGNGVPEGQLQFVKQEKQGTQNFGKSSLPPNVTINRVLHLGIDWFVTSTVVRQSPIGSSVYLRVPLLEGESVTDDAFTITDNTIEVYMGPNVKRVQWSSILKKTEEVILTAPETTKWTETWKLDASPIWHIETAGIPVIQYYSKNETWQPEWRPWAGEKVTLNITRPPGVEGSTKTIDSSKLKIVPGIRSTNMELMLVMRSTRGDQQKITLPEGGTLQSVKINTVQQPIKNDKTIIIPLNPGSQQIEIAMSSTQAMSTFFKVPEIDLGMESVNNEIEVQTGKRWVWFVRGPQTGPAILFYSELFIILLVAIALGYSKLTPLSSLKWLILGLGLSQSGLIPSLLIVSWFIALQFRKRKGGLLSGAIFNLAQCAVVGITLLAAGALVYAVQHGLLGHPDMQIVGNNSSSHYLRWYQDHISALMPQPLVVSIPIMAYRVLMLLWALWLAFNLLSWVKWGWECVTTDKNWDDFNFKRNKQVEK